MVVNWQLIKRVNSAEKVGAAVSQLSAVESRSENVTE